ncbi:thialysine N-epsilon-acetyltransferase-like [Arctopsyche grandis]|uniref:thialysine N-epsilon-acetyltransferase-like n=1 Tax=Arctopsyche grandis TaxID=121162 RepID=UPI00406DA1AD
MSNFTVRKAKKEDMVHIMKKIIELAAFEGYPEGPKITASDLERDGFESDCPYFFCIVVEQDETNKIVGYALGNYAYSSWTGRAMYLEDFYVDPELRGLRLGHKLFKEMCKMARDTGCHRIDWHCLVDNNLATKFYESHGAFDVCKAESRTCYRITNDEILNIANL